MIMAILMACHGPRVSSHFIFTATIRVSANITPIYRWGSRGCGLFKVTPLVNGRDRIQTQVCSTPKTTNFARKSHAAPQTWISFWAAHRAESHILIPGTRPRQDHWQRSFYFPLPCQYLFPGISLTPQGTELFVSLPKGLWLGNTLFF